ncbi:TRAP transporter, DctQ family protein [Stappia sp. 22II-S9-Z10]|nr:TRAP transporter, DctQ family protein [Stappia sp. 22II-S9-Z10]
MVWIATIGRISRAISLVAVGLACAALLVLIGITLYEVIMRYAFRAPTRWAFDLAWMLNGASFLLAAAFALRHRQHVVIDVFSNALPARVRHAITGFAFILLVLPALGILGQAAWIQTYSAYVTGEIDRVSPWQAVIWPFRLAVAAALTSLAIEVLYQGLNEAAAALRGRTAPASAP